MVIFTDNNNFLNVFWWFVIIAFLIGILFSNAILPISTVVLVVFSLWSVKFRISFVELKKNPIVLWFLLLYLIYLTGVFITESKENWLRDIFIKLPLLVFPLIFLNKKINQLIVLQNVVFIFNVFVCMVGLASFINYLIDYQYYNDSIFKAKPIPVITGLNHIYFSMMLAFSALNVFAGLIVKTKISENLKISKYYTIVNVVMLILYFVFLHTISARTGLIAFYFSFVFITVFFLVQKRKHYHSVVIIVVMALTGFLSVKYVDSLHNRYMKTIEDIKVYQQKGNINYYSFSTRVEYWKACFHLFKKNPLFGTGNADLKSELYKYLTENKPVLDERNRLDPHNQYLQVLAGTGIFGFLIFTGLMLFLLLKAMKLKNYYLLPLVLVVSISFLGESVLERQAGIAFVLFFILLGWKIGELQTEKH